MTTALIRITLAGAPGWAGKVAGIGSMGVSASATIAQVLEVPSGLLIHDTGPGAGWITC